MSRFWMTGIAGFVAMALVTCGQSIANDQAAPKKTRQHTAQKPVASDAHQLATQAGAARQHGGKAHLPAAFSKLNLNPDQQQKAMAVAEKYAGQIRQLRSQLRDLQSKRDAELAAFLNDSQKKMLAEAKTSAPKTTTAAAAPHATPKLTLQGGKFKINPAELKSLHDQAMKNIAAESKAAAPQEKAAAKAQPKSPNNKSNAKKQAQSKTEPAKEAPQK